MEKMANPHKSTTAAARRRTVAEKYLRGFSQCAIAAETGVSQPMVSKDLKIIRAQWRESSIRDFDTLKAEQLEKIDLCEAESFKSFALSRLDSMRTLKEQHAGKDRVSVVTETHAAGDARWITTILACIERRISLLGLAEPTRYKIDWSHITEEQLLRLSNGEPARDVLQPGPAPMAEA